MYDQLREVSSVIWLRCDFFALLARMQSKSKPKALNQTSLLYHYECTTRIIRVRQRTIIPLKSNHQLYGK